jgi:hypothetical protein
LRTALFQRDGERLFEFHAGAFQIIQIFVQQSEQAQAVRHRGVIVPQCAFENIEVLTQ